MDKKKLKINVENHNTPNPFHSDNKQYDNYAILKAMTMKLPPNTISMSPEDKERVENYPVNEQVIKLLKEMKTIK